MSCLELRAVKKRFKSQTVLDGIDLEVEEGETVVVFGPSGAGKTVLLRLIAGVIDPDEGSIAIDGEDVTDLPPESRRLGMAFQNFALFPHLSAFDNIASPLVARRNSAEAVDLAVRTVAKLLKIEHVLGHAPRQLSNGQKQRTALARALAAKPSLLLLDDPLRNVDAKLRYEMRIELPRLIQGYGATVLYVTQDYREAMALGDRIAILIGGKLQQVGTPAEIYETPVSVEVARLFGDPTINLVPVRPTANGDAMILEIGGRAIATPPLARAMDRDCFLGVRPEAFLVQREASQRSFAARVEAVTPLNEKIVSLLRTASGQELLASRPSQNDGPPAGASVHVALPEDGAVLFDRQTGRRLNDDASRRRS